MKYLLTNRNVDSMAEEFKSAEMVGFEIKQVNYEAVFREDEYEDLQGQSVFVRHYHDDADFFKEYVADINATMLIDRYETANEWSDIIIKNRSAEYGTRYRCFVVGDTISTIDTVNNRAVSAAHDFINRCKDLLPNSYCLDIVQLKSGEFVPAKLIDIGSAEFYDGHNLYKFYRDVYNLPE